MCFLMLSIKKTFNHKIIMELNMKRVFFFLTLISFLSVNIYGQAIPRQFDYQGVLKTSAGGIVPDGNYPMTFKMYNDPSGGSALWSETQTVAVANGIFSVHLGSSTPITGVPFNRIHFLGITLGTEPELMPRTMLTPSPYSFMSMDIMDNIVTTPKLQDGAVTGVKIGANNVVKSINGLKDNITLLAGTNITLTPSGNNITINASGGGGGTVTQVNTGAGLTGGPITTSGTISIPSDGVTGTMLQGNSVTSAKIVDGTVATADLGDNAVTSAKIADGSITNADINNSAGIVTSKLFGDAGIEFNTWGSTYYTISENNASVVNMGSIVLSAPTTGYIVVWLNGHTIFFGNRKLLNIGVNTSSTSLLDDASVTIGRLDGTETLRFYNSFTAVGVFTVSTPGNYTIYALAQGNTTFGVGIANVVPQTMTAIFIPKRY